MGRACRCTCVVALRQTTVRGTAPDKQVPGFPVLGYRPGEPQGSPDAVRRHLRMLHANGWSLLGVSEALAVAAARPRHPVAGITLDGAAGGTLAVAEVVLELGAGATVHVPVDRVTERPVRSGAPGALSWGQVGELAAAGLEIGSGASTGVPLDVLGPRALSYELQGSRRRLREHLGVDVASLQYPGGCSTRRVRAAARAAGYLNACGQGQRLVRVPGDAFAVPRIFVPDGAADHEVAELVSVGGGDRWREAAAPLHRMARRALRLLG